MSLQLREITTTDVPMLRDLAARNPPLDVHTDYTYWVMATLGADYSCVAELDGDLVGYVTALPGREPGTAFVWQVCVDHSQRGHGIGRQLLLDTARRMRNKKIEQVTVTIEPRNLASLALFKSVFGDNGLAIAGSVELRPGELYERQYVAQL